MHLFHSRPGLPEALDCIIQQEVVKSLRLEACRDEIAAQHAGTGELLPSEPGCIIVEVNAYDLISEVRGEELRPSYNAINVQESPVSRGDPVIFGE
jgi:hypothetical protein